MGKIHIAAANRAVASFWAIAILILVLCVLYGDMTGAGLKNTMYYGVLGPVLYVIFYGAASIVLVRLIVIYIRARDYITADTNNIYIAGKTFPISDIKTVSIDTGALGLRLLKISGDRDFSVKLYSLKESGEKVLENIESVIKKDARF